MPSTKNPRTYIDETVENGRIENFELLLLNLGSLAPSTHNTQPWLLDKARGSITVYPDYEMQVPHADPHNKYLFISIGAFIGNIVEFLEAIDCHFHIVFHQKLQSVKMTFDTPEDKELSNKAKKSLQNIASRQNFRGFYNKPKKTDIEKISSILSKHKAISFTTETRKVQQLSELTAKAVEHAYGNKEFRQEISSLINHNRSRRKVGLHGYSLRLKQVQSLIMPQIMRHKNIGEKLGSLNKKSFDTSHAVCVYTLAEKNNGVEGWIEAGMNTERTMLTLQEAGFATSIYVASLESDGSRKAVEKILDTKKKTPVILFTAGKAPDTLPHSARLSVAEKMKI